MRNNFIRKAIFGIKQKWMPITTGNAAQELIRESIESDSPLMIARFGAVEIKSLIYSLLPPPICCLLRRYTYEHIGNNAGFFPVEEGMLKRYAELLLQDMQSVDILASWRPEELFFKKRLRHAKRVALGDLGPVMTNTLWSRTLRGKRVLVIHPFAKSIEHQYTHNRSRLFGDLSDIVLPEFASLQVLPAVQTIAGNRCGFETWFDALEYMEREIDKSDFDIALIGCGAYGFHLAAYIKRQGRQAVHIGGPLQLYFGIKGKRWDGIGFYNDAWIAPDESEKPENLSRVEGGCYW